MTQSQAPTKDKTFLAIDLDEKQLGIIRRYLTMDGARSVLTTALPQHGLDMMRSANPPVDCIVCAEDLAPFTGIELLKGLRSGRYGDAPYIRGIKFIMVTAHKELDLVMAVKALDGDGYIVKPINYNSFARHVQDALRHTYELKQCEFYRKVDVKKASHLPVLLRKA